MRWVTCLSHASLSHVEIRVTLAAALQSALANTKLVPTLVINNGETPLNPNDPLLREFEIIQWTSPFLARVEQYARTNFGDRLARVRSGAYLRYEIPRIGRHFGWGSGPCLYTDHDVIFTASPEFPEFRSERIGLAVPPLQPLLSWTRRRPTNRPHYNSGVILFNMDKPDAWIDDFHKFVETDGEGVSRDRSHKLNAKHLMMSDQAALNSFASNRDIIQLSPFLNWPAMRGLHRKTSILHFNGPKWTDFIGLTPQDADANYLDTKNRLMSAAGRRFAQSVLIALEYVRPRFASCLY